MVRQNAFFLGQRRLFNFQAYRLQPDDRRPLCALKSSSRSRRSCDVVCEVESVSLPPKRPSRVYPSLLCFRFPFSCFRSSAACFIPTSSWCASACLSSDRRATSLFPQKTWSWPCSTTYCRVISTPPFAGGESSVMCKCHAILGDSGA